MNDNLKKEKIPRLPPGQHISSKFPILQKGRVAHINRENYKLEIEGEVEKPVTLTLKELKELEDKEIIGRTIRVEEEHHRKLEEILNKVNEFYKGKSGAK